MPSLAGIAAFARQVGVVAPVAPLYHAGATERATGNNEQTEQLRKSVAPVAPVAPNNGDTWEQEDLQVAFDERAAILEYDGGWPRAEAERLARIEVFGDV